MNLKELRKSRNLTLKEVAHGTGIHPAAVSHYENGNREPNIRAIRKLADYYGVEVEKVFVCAEQSMKRQGAAA